MEDESVYRLAIVLDVAIARMTGAFLVSPAVIVRGTVELRGKDAPAALLVHHARPLQRG